ncbi:hypothetical protein [Bradyrhizobium sp. G127]|uniref:hypothetical protein n=1 Tax=Bradyrhizobium sp. G127 TaxID=2904800 RepID=UPI001F2ED99C|nr:hypothetical protein [Bradyrhizobium sp. G127]MCF2524845.1 hypothetical protein [Bradyrhizobium sp. G127]
MPIYREIEVTSFAQDNTGVDVVSLETLLVRKAHCLRAFLHQKNNILQKLDWLAGDTVLLAPVSA